MPGGTQPGFNSQVLNCCLRRWRRPGWEPPLPDGCHFLPPALAPTLFWNLVCANLPCVPSLEALEPGPSLGKPTATGVGGSLGW